MGFSNAEAMGLKKQFVEKACAFILPVFICLLVLGSVRPVLAIQRNALDTGESHGPALQEPGHEGSSHTPSLPSHQEQQPATNATNASPQVQVPHPAVEPEVPNKANHGTVDSHKADKAGHGAAHEHGPALPEISPIAGVSFVDTLTSLMDYELNGRFLGWRPNDLVIGRFTDDVNNYQLGVLETVRFTTLRLKDSLTRMGDADAYDNDLEQALNLLMNKATRFWFPSAESSYNESLDHLRKFRRKLEGGQRSYYHRIDNLLLLLSTYKDLLGNVNRSLIMANHSDGTPVSWFETDDYFYYAKGVSHVMYEILRVVRVDFKDQLTTINAADMMDEILHELHRAEQMDPWLILDSDFDGFFANHRANLNAPLSEVTHLLSVITSLK